MLQKICSCWPKPDQKLETPRIPDDDATYGTIDDSDDRKPGVSFRTKAKSEGNKFRQSNSMPENSSKNSEPSRRSLVFGFKFGKKQKSVPNRELPKLPKKTFSRNLPAIDDVINPTYESIDAENDSISDPLYSKVDENPASQRYDYPTFRTKIIASAAAKRKITPGTTEEPLYTSASQIYSGGSEDPYSSIVSESGGRRGNQSVRFDDNNSSIYDPGYARVKDPKPSTSNNNNNNPGPSSSTREIPLNIDQLYAKINRPSVRRLRDSNNDGDDAPDSATTSRPTVVSFAQDLNNPNNDSGSEITYSSSANPSYRYLTVRETVDVVRERIRQRQENQGEAADAINGPIREHYYSTIANEYESVGGGSLSDSIYGIPVVNASARTASPLTLNVARLSGIFDANPPHPPTSPIPNRQPPSRPIIIPQAPSANTMMSTSLHGPPRILTSPTSVIDEKANSNPNLTANHHRSTTRFEPGPPFQNSWHSQTAANNRILFPRGNPRIIPPVSSSTVFTSSIINSRDSFQSQRSIDTPTRELVDSETQTNTSSRIPISTARLTRQRSQSPSVDSATQTQEVRRSRLNLSAMKPSTSLNPLPSGRDYISPIDLTTKRAWPLNNNEASIDRNNFTKEK